MSDAIKDLLAGPVKVVNIGLEGFEAELSELRVSRLCRSTGLRPLVVTRSWPTLLSKLGA